MKTMRDWAIGIGVVVGIIAVVLLGLGIGDRVRLNVYLFVDNAGAEPAIVKLEGAAVLTVAPRSVGIVYTRHGDRQIRVERAGQPVFEKEITIDSPGFFGVSKYIVNPKQESGYWVWAKRYGQQFNPPTPDLHDPTAIYHLIAREIPLIGNMEWFLVPSDKSEFVLTENPPDSIEVKNGQTAAVKYQVCRMERQEHDMIQSAPEKQNVNEDELKEMAVIVAGLLTRGGRPAP